MSEGNERTTKACVSEVPKALSGLRGLGFKFQGLEFRFCWIRVWGEYAFTPTSSLFGVIKGDTMS